MLLERIVKALGFMALCTSVVTASRPSMVSDEINYDEQGFEKDVRIMKGYRIGLSLFKIVKLNDASNTKFELLITCPVALLNSVDFYDNRKGMMKKIVFINDIQRPQFTNFVYKASVEDINSYLSEFFVERSKDKQADGSEERSFEVIYNIRPSINTGQSLYDGFSQTVRLTSKLMVDIIPQITTLYLNPGKMFTFELLQIRENEAVWSNQSITRRTGSNAIFNFFGLRVSDNGKVIIEGKSPQRLGQSSKDRAAVRVEFSLKDSVTGLDSDLYSFFLEIDPEKLQQNEQFKLIFLTALICTFVIVLFFCLYLVLKREKTQQKEEVKQVMQAEIPENILTKSILEWNKEVTSTRDHTTKDRDSVFYNPYDKYSLKKKDGNRIAKGKAQYANLKTNGDDSNKGQDHSQSTHGMMSNKEEDPLKQKIERKKSEENVNAEIELREGRNVSQLEFSKVEEFNTNLDKKHKDFEFGDLSKILNEGGGTGGEETNAKKDQDINLDDIFLKDI